MTFSGDRKTGAHYAHALTHVRTHRCIRAIAFIRPCDSQQSEEGHRTPRSSPRIVLPFLPPSLSLSLFVSLCLWGSLAIVVATPAPKQQIKPSGGRTEVDQLIFTCSRDKAAAGTIGIR